MSPVTFEFSCTSRPFTFFCTICLHYCIKCRFFYYLYLQLIYSRYVRHEQRSLMELSKEAILASRVEWGPLPDWKGMANQKKGAGESKREQTKLHLKPERATSGDYKGLIITKSVIYQVFTTSAPLR